jgi:serine/threonine protein kinase
MLNVEGLAVSASASSPAETYTSTRMGLESAPQSKDPIPRVGTVLNGKWRIEGLLGTGGMATVFRATHRNGHRVAIKMLRTELSRDSELRRRFLREGYAANAIDHPAVVRVLNDDVTDDGEAFLVMDLLEGETLEAHCERKRPSEAALSEITQQVLDLLAAGWVRFEQLLAGGRRGYGVGRAGRHAVQRGRLGRRRRELRA